MIVATILRNKPPCMWRNALLGYGATRLDLLKFYKGLDVLRFPTTTQDNINTLICR
ncbi:hypothetical protein Tsubulata_013331, partial [Turnera subulata]